LCPCPFLIDKTVGGKGIHFNLAENPDTETGKMEAREEVRGTEVRGGRLSHSQRERRVEGLHPPLSHSHSEKGRVSHPLPWLAY